MNNLQKRSLKFLKLSVTTDMSLRSLFLSIFFFLLSSLSFAQPAPPQKTRLLFVFDDSFSMFGDWQSGKKIEVAKKLMSEFLDSLMKTSGGPDIEIALRVYGHQSPLWP